MNKIGLFLASLIILIGLSAQVKAANNQTNVSGSNTSIEGGYEISTKYQSGS